MNHGVTDSRNEIKLRCGARRFGNSDTLLYRVAGHIQAMVILGVIGYWQLRIQDDSTVLRKSVSGVGNRKKNSHI